MPVNANQERRLIPALKVRQWLSAWDEIPWGTSGRGPKPREEFLQFSMNAPELRALCGIYPRTTSRERAATDLGIQRRHEPKRSKQIREYVRFGHPWSDLSESKRASGEFSDLQYPGWLPTAIVVNILSTGDVRNGRAIAARDAVDVIERDTSQAAIELPAGFTGSAWRPKSIAPLEVIDGQHRLWAFESSDLGGEYELPIVAFIGLSVNLQAYLFYTINIKPKKINASLAYDLYPLLRTQEWLTKFEGHIVYRESRAQELVDLLWSHPDSPWRNRINMLGETGQKGRMVTQASWVRSLLASLVKSWEGPGIQIGGLFGASVGKHDTVLPWSRLDQCAFLILAGQLVVEALEASTEPWVLELKSAVQDDVDALLHPAFIGPHTLLNQDQGIRVLLQVFNDILFVQSDELRLVEWGEPTTYDTPDHEVVSARLDSLKQQDLLFGAMSRLASCCAAIDWRSSDAPGLSQARRQLKASFRGSGGYKELRKYALEQLSGCVGATGQGAREVITRLGY